jgi:hypothetical protein
MRSLTTSERRTLRLGAIALGIYLTLFLGFQGWRAAAERRAEYRRLQTEAMLWRERLKVYADKARVAGELMEEFRFDPVQLARTSVVAQASAAIQRAALGGGLQLGPVRESAGRGSGRELAAIQLEGVGPPVALLRFLHEVGRLGFPLIADSVQFTPEPGPTGRLKLNVTLVILDFERWDTNLERPRDV